MNNNNTTTQNFTRGSLIELANGDIKRVEEMRTEDFILSAEKSSELELADSTVVKLTQSSTNNQIVFITFSYDNNRSKVSNSIIIRITSTLINGFYVYFLFGVFFCAPIQCSQRPLKVCIESYS